MPRKRRLPELVPTIAAARCAGRGTAWPKLSLPVRLALLVAGTTLPLIVFAVGIVFHDYNQDRKEATQRVLETVRSIRLTLDAEIQRMTGGLQVLALTNALRNGDFKASAASPTVFSSNTARTASILVADRDGRSCFPRSTADAADLPLRNNREIVEKVFVTKQPQYSNLFTGAVKKRLIVTVEVPVFRDGEVIYDISFSPPLEMFQTIIEKQRPSEDWTISLLDGDGVDVRPRAQPGGDGRQARLAFALCRDDSTSTEATLRRCRSRACR